MQSKWDYRTSFLEDHYILPYLTKQNAEVISKLQPWLDVSMVLSSTGSLCCLKLASQHSPAVAAWGFTRKLEEQGDAFNPFRRV